MNKDKPISTVEEYCEVWQKKILPTGYGDNADAMARGLFYDFFTQLYYIANDSNSSMDMDVLVENLLTELQNSYDEVSGYLTQIVRKREYAAAGLPEPELKSVDIVIDYEVSEL
jgi:hypothetical protein